MVRTTKWSYPGWHLPPALHDAVRLFAQQTHRSVNASAIMLLERAMRAAEESGEFDPRG